MLRRGVTSVSEKMFPGITYPKVEFEAGFLMPGYETISSLPLHMAVYFNIIIFPFWVAVIIFMTYIKFACLTYTTRFLLVTGLVAIVLNECLRLYLGYSGNLLEKSPELAAFWMLSLLLQLPSQLFLLFNRAAMLFPVEKTVQAVMIALLLAQIVTGYIALRTSCSQQVKRYQIMQIHLAKQRQASRVARGQSRQD